MELNLNQPELSFDTNILDVDIPHQFMNAISTGNPMFDSFFTGDGVVAGTAAFVTGVPGGGKSTFLISLADSFTSADCVCLYNAGEESIFQIRRTAQRLRLKNGFIPSYHTYVEDIIEHCENLKLQYPDKQIVLFQDSLQCLRERPSDVPTRGRKPAEDKQAYRALEVLLSYTKSNWIPMFVVGQVNKDGSFKGPNGIKHVIDVHVHLDYRIKENERFLMVEKNRFGSAGMEFEFYLQEDGILFNRHVETSSSDDDIFDEDF